jgi:hypothetical protein
MPDATQMQAPAVQMVSAEANGDKGTTLMDVPLCLRSRIRELMSDACT